MPIGADEADRADPDVAALWSDHAATGDKEPLLLRYSALVRHVAARLGSDLPPFVELADLVSCGMFGLIDAIDKFDPERAVRFETYAALRIRGAILDGLRTVDWVPRSVRTRIRAVERAESALQMRLNRMPTETEVAEELGMSLASLRKLSAELAVSRVVPLDEVRHRRSFDGALAAVAAGPPSHAWRADQPGEALEAAEQARAVASAIHGLCDRDRTVIDLYYYRGLKLTEIGRMLGVTEARVSQLHARARSALRKSLLAMDV